MAITLAPQAQPVYPGNDSAALGLVSAMWEPVAVAYTQLTATVHPGGAEDAA